MDAIGIAHFGRLLGLRVLRLPTSLWLASERRTHHTPKLHTYHGLCLTRLVLRVGESAYAGFKHPESCIRQLKQTELYYTRSKLLQTKCGHSGSETKGDGERVVDEYMVDLRTDSWTVPDWKGRAGLQIYTKRSGLGRASKGNREQNKPYLNPVPFDPEA